jgi:16S rRNA G1207 methylase RsmC
LSNAFSEAKDIRFHNVVSNLPAHTGRETLYIMLCGAKEHLLLGGQIVVVTISGLKEFIKRNLLAVFGNYEKLKQGKTHLVSRALHE